MASTITPSELMARRLTGHSSVSSGSLVSKAFPFNVYASTELRRQHLAGGQFGNFGKSLSVAHRTEAIETKDLERVAIDNTSDGRPAIYS